MLATLQAGAVAYDELQTSRVLAAGGHELDPLARPVTSAGRPVMAVFGYAEVAGAAWLADRMRHSKKRLVQRLWWLPQVAGIAGHAAAIGVSPHSLGN